MTKPSFLQLKVCHMRAAFLWSPDAGWEPVLLEFYPVLLDDPAACSLLLTPSIHSYICQSSDPIICSLYMRLKFKQITCSQMDCLDELTCWLSLFRARSLSYIPLARDSVFMTGVVSPDDHPAALCSQATLSACCQRHFFAEESAFFGINLSSAFKQDKYYLAVYERHKP